METVSQIFEKTYFALFGNNTILEEAQYMRNNKI